ncbi:MAG: Helix-turn-helix domain [Thermoanaerobacter sp.]|nr:Helix-turn-helix domain [Thermoanaerobacter sp.]
MGIRAIRERCGMSRAELSRRTGIDYSTLWKIEKGLIALFPGWRRRIAEALGVDERELMTDGKEEVHPA